MSASGSLCSNVAHERRDALLEEVVAQVHDERLVAEERLADEHRVREAQRRLLRQVRDAEAEPAAVADRGLDLGARLADDDADLGDAGGAHGLEAVEQHRLVGHGHELLGGGVRDGAQARAGAAAEDESLHGRAPLAPGVRWSRRRRARRPSRWRAGRARCARRRPCRRRRRSDPSTSVTRAPTGSGNGAPSRTMLVSVERSMSRVTSQLSMANGSPSSELQPRLSALRR